MTGRAEIAFGTYTDFGTRYGDTAITRLLAPFLSLHSSFLGDATGIFS